MGISEINSKYINHKSERSPPKYNTNHLKKTKNSGKMHLPLTFSHLQTPPQTTTLLRSKSFCSSSCYKSTKITLQTLSFVIFRRMKVCHATNDKGVFSSFQNQVGVHKLLKVEGAICISFPKIFSILFPPPLNKQLLLHINPLSFHTSSRSRHYQNILNSCQNHSLSIIVIMGNHSVKPHSTH